MNPGRGHRRLGTLNRHRLVPAGAWRRRAAVAALALGLWLVATAAQACPSCKSALATSGQGDLVGGFMWSILFMLSMPFACVTGFSTYLYLLVRRARAEQLDQGEPARPPGEHSFADGQPPPS